MWNIKVSKGLARSVPTKLSHTRKTGREKNIWNTLLQESG